MMTSGLTLGMALTPLKRLSMAMKLMPADHAGEGAKRCGIVVNNQQPGHNFPRSNPRGENPVRVPDGVYTPGGTDPGKPYNSHQIVQPHDRLGNRRSSVSFYPKSGDGALPALGCGGAAVETPPDTRGLIRSPVFRPIAFRESPVAWQGTSLSMG